MDLKDVSLPVVETFTSIQGESTHAGRLCFFIRLAGCNLKCSYCDTVYAQHIADGIAKPLAEIIDEAKKSSANLVEITGGEPAWNKPAHLLAQGLIDEGFEVLLETNGSVPIDQFPEQVKRIIDVKLPSSGMDDFNNPDIYTYIKPGDEIKFVTGSREDFIWALKWIDQWRLQDKNVPIIFSCVFGKVEPQELVEWIIEANRPYLRFQLQLHKYIWDPAARSV